MGMLDRKLARDLWRLRTQALAIVLLVAVAVATFTGALSTYRSLFESQRRTYETFRFAQIFASLQRAPEAVAGHLERLSGVAEVETRVVTSALLEIEGLEEPVRGLLVSIPDGRMPRLNRLFLRAGRLPDPDHPWEVLVHEAFAKAHGLAPGDSLPAVVRGHRERLEMVGIALAPDFIYAVSPGEMLGDDRRFGIFWMQRTALARAAGLDGAFNDVSLRLAEDARVPEVISLVDQVLAPYGSPGAGGRDRNISHRYLSDEIRQLKGTAVTVPSLFLAVAAFLLHVTLSRVVATQREQIGTLKALGLTHGEVGWHYARMVAAVVIMGLGLGLVGGVWIGRWWTRIYAAFYRMPLYVYRMDPDLLASALGVSVMAAAVGTWGALRQVLRMPPAEAMRPPAPPIYGSSLLERLIPSRRLSPTGRMVLRNVGRRPVRAALSSLGIAFAIALLISGYMPVDAMKAMLDMQFGRVYREDVAVTFTDPLHPESLQGLRDLPGVRVVEPFRSVPVTFRAGHRSYATVLNGVPAGSRLRRVLDLEGRRAAVPGRGVLLTKALADLLAVSPGQEVVVEVLEGRRPCWVLPVSGTVQEPLGSQGWLDLEALQEMLDDGGRVSGAAIRVNEGDRTSLFRSLRGMPRVAGVVALAAMRRNFDQMMGQYLVVFALMLVALAGLMVAGVVYNTARVSLAERERELASLRVLGFTRAEVFRVVLGEMFVHVALALPLGCLLGYAFCRGMLQSFSNDLYRIPMVQSAPTYAFACVVAVVMTGVVALGMRRRVDRLDLIGVLKTRE